MMRNIDAGMDQAVVARIDARLADIRLNPDEAVAPMHFPTLLQGCDAPAEIVDIVTDLMVRKAVTRELGSEPLPGPVLAFIDAEFVSAHEAFPTARRPILPESLQRAEEFFRATVRRLER